MDWGLEEGGGPRRGKGVRIPSPLPSKFHPPPAKPGLKARSSVLPPLLPALPHPWDPAAGSRLPLIGSEGGSPGRTPGDAGVEIGETVLPRRRRGMNPMRAGRTGLRGQVERGGGHSPSLPPLEDG